MVRIRVDAHRDGGGEYGGLRQKKKSKVVLGFGSQNNLLRCHTNCDGKSIRYDEPVEAASSQLRGAVVTQISPEIAKGQGKSSVTAQFSLHYHPANLIKKYVENRDKYFVLYFNMVVSAKKKGL